MTTNQMIHFWGCLIVANIWSATGNLLMAGIWLVLMSAQIFWKDTPSG